MTSPIFNQMPYLRTSRQFPEELHDLTVEISRSYIDIANAVNNRTIAIFPVNKPVITGERYFIIGNQPQQTLRQIFAFTSTVSINHGITVNDPNQFTHCYGSYTDGTNSYGLPFATSVAVAGLITFYTTKTQIVFVTGAGAPPITPNGAGRIVLEWLSQV